VFDRVAPQVVGELAPADDAGDHGSRVDPDPETEAFPTRSRDAKHLERHVGSGADVVRPRGGDPRCDHVCIADRLDLQAVALRQLVEVREDLIEQLDDLVRLDRGGDSG